MPPSMQIDNQNVTVYTSLEDGTKQSTLSFLVNPVDGTPFVQFAAGNANGAIRVTNLAAPAVGADATNKEYVDSVARGLTVKNPVRLMQTTNVTLANVTPDSIVDGKAVRENDRVLLIGQQNAVENGIYVVTTNGLVRADDMVNGTTASGVYVFIDEGVTYMDRSFVCITDRVDTNNAPSSIVGTFALEWVQFGARPTALAGNGLALGNANQLDVNVDGTTLQVVADVVQITNPDVKVKVERGLLRSTTNGTIATTAVSDPVDPAVLGATVGLGTNITVAPDFTVLPDLQNDNTFTAKNTYNNNTAASWTVDGQGAVTLDGAVVVTGGVAVRQNLIVNDALVKAATDSSSTSTGAFVVQGGVGIAKTLRCAGDVYTAAVHSVSADAAAWAATDPITGALTVDGGAVVRNDLHTGTFVVHSDADSTSTSTGAVTIIGGLGVAKNVTCPTAHLVGTTTSTSSTTGALTVAGGVGVAENVNVGNNCNVTAALTTNTGHVLATTAATSTATGALVVDGGLGLAGALFVGDVAHVAGTAFADNTADAGWQSVGPMTGAVQVEGGVAVRKNIHGANLYAKATTTSTSTTTGALVVSGGAGVAENLYVGGTANITDVTHCNSTTDATWDTLNPLIGSLVVEGGLSVRKDVHQLHTTAHSTDNGTWDAVAALGGSIVTEGGLSVRKDVHCLNGQVHSSTPATSQSTGALVVTGGIGVGGNIFCNSTYNMSDARLKRNPTRIDDALERVCNLNGYTFEWNERMDGLEGTLSVGVLAQEVKEQAPLCVLQNPETDLYAVEYTKLLPYMIESIKTLKRKCDSLEQQLYGAPRKSSSDGKGGSSKKAKR